MFRMSARLSFAMVLIALDRRTRSHLAPSDEAIARERLTVSTRQIGNSFARDRSCAPVMPGVNETGHLDERFTN